MSLYIFECPINVAGRCQEEQQGETSSTGDPEHVLAPGLATEDNKPLITLPSHHMGNAKMGFTTLSDQIYSFL